MQENLANAIGHLINAISAVAGSTPSGAPHGMTWVDLAKGELAKFWQEFAPPAPAGDAGLAAVGKAFAPLPVGDAGVPSAAADDQPPAS